MKTLLTLALLAFGLFAADAQHQAKKYTHTTDTYIDPRDGKEYPVITFIKTIHGGVTIKRTWFADNVKYKVDGSLCYNDIEEYCDKYGRLYNYEQASKACPEGWHVPTIHEWKHLFHFFGGRHHTGKFLFDEHHPDMNMLYGGFGEPGPTFRGLLETGNWWDNELKDANSAGIITLKNESPHVFHNIVGDNHYLSTRCVLFHN